MKFAQLFAYIDPASGSIIFQLILAFVLGILVYIKKIKAFIIGLFRKKSKNNSE